MVSISSRKSYDQGKKLLKTLLKNVKKKIIPTLLIGKQINKGRKIQKPFLCW